MCDIELDMGYGIFLDIWSFIVQFANSATVASVLLLSILIMVLSTYISKWSILESGVGQGFCAGVPAAGESEVDMLARELAECRQQLEDALTEVRMLNHDESHVAWQHAVECGRSTKLKSLQLTVQSQAENLRVVRAAKLETENVLIEGRDSLANLRTVMTDLWNSNKLPINFWTHWLKLDQYAAATEVVLQTPQAVTDCRYGIIYNQDDQDEGLGGEDFGGRDDSDDSDVDEYYDVPVPSDPVVIPSEPVYFCYYPLFVIVCILILLLFSML